jgi:hypothetical protein
MRNKKRWVWLIVLLAIVLIIKLYAANAHRVETGYVTQFYPAFAKALRFLLGWLPFSAGDILYGLVSIWLLWKLIKGIQVLWQRKASWLGTGLRLLKTGIMFLLIYIVFNAFWGINYNRKGIAWQLGLNMQAYTINELKNMNSLLLQKTNAAKKQLVGNAATDLSTQQMFKKVTESYAIADSAYPFLQYQNTSLKPSLWGWLGNYVGFTGYYNPFTGEAQVNTTVPKFLQPFTTCHEVAHQLGYAKENEANFVGYLAAVASPDERLHYAVYLDMFLYSNRNLYNSDSAAARNFAKALMPEIKEDLKEWRLFNARHKNPIEPVIRWLYGKYLENNEQPQGVLSYDAVTSFLIAYYKKFGKI